MTVAVERIRKNGRQKIGTRRIQIRIAFSKATVGRINVGYGYAILLRHTHF